MSILTIILVVLAIAFVFFQRMNTGKNATENIQIGEKFMIEKKAQEELISTASGLR